MRSSTLLWAAWLGTLAACGESAETPPEAAPPARPAPLAAQPAATVPTPTFPNTAATAGGDVYRQTCAFCHDKGVAGAPRPGDGAVWGTRMALGIEALYRSAIQGKGAMPAKGGNPALNDAEVRAAVDHLLAQSR
jgi:cytochrome c5